jgi:NAD(P)H dehydrogenase (quinone)
MGSDLGDIVLFGAAGKTGRAVARALLGRGVPAARLRRLLRPGGTSAARPPGGALPGDRSVDVADPDALAAAVAGAHVLHVVVPNLHPAERRIVEGAVTAARAGGVGRIVYHSVLRPGLRAMPHHWGKLEAEEVLWGSGLEVTVLQPSAYAQNLVACVDAGELVVPYSVDVPFSLVDLDELAEVTARVLVEPGTHAAACYELAGPVATVREVGERLGLGARRRPPGPSGPDDGYAAMALHGMFDWYDRHGLPGHPGVLQAMLGRAPRPAHLVLAEAFDR